MAYKDSQAIRLARVFFKDRPLPKIARPDIEDFRAWKVGQGSSNATTNHSIQTLSYFFNWAKNRGYILHNPAEGTKLRLDNERVVILEPFEMKELLERTTEWERKYVVLGMFTGLRHSEMGNLQWNQVNLAGRQIILEAKVVKGKRTRVIPIGDYLLNHLLAEREKNPTGNFVIGGNRAIGSFKTSWNSIRRRFAWVRDRDLRIHDLRHIYATTLVNQGVDIKEIAQILGHRSIQTTLKYAHFNGRIRKETANRIEQYIFG